MTVHILKDITNIAEIAIATTAIFSIFVARKSLYESRKNSAMSTAPTLLITPKFNLIKKDSQSSDSFKEEPEDYNLHIWTELIIKNTGRGVALNISQPNYISQSYATNWPEYIPIFLEKDNSLNFFIVATKRFSECKSMYVNGNRIIIDLEINYKNDQNNINCKSSINITLQPFIYKDGILTRAKGAEIISVDNFNVQYEFLDNI